MPRKTPAEDAPAEHGPRKRPPTQPLTKRRIVAAALDIIDRDGLEKLSMRRLGKELDVDPMAVYYHVPNKSALYDAIMDVIVGGMADADLPRDLPFEDFIVTAGNLYQEVLTRHMRALPLLISRPMRTEHTLAVIEMMLERLLGIGLTPEEAIAAVDTFANYVTGAVSQHAQHEAQGEYHEDMPVEDLSTQLDPEQFPNLLRAFAEAEYMGFDKQFDFSLRVLARGFEATATRNAGRGT